MVKILKVKNILEEIKTSNKIRVLNEYGEEYYPPYAELIRLQEREVCSIDAYGEDTILLEIKEEMKEPTF